MRGILVGVALIALGLGCSQPITMAPTPVYSPQKHIVNSSASVGEVAKAVVGDPLLKVKDYWITTRADDSMTPSFGCVFKGGPNTISVVEGGKLKIVGETVLDGRKLKALEAAGAGGMLLLVDPETGKPSTKVINGIGGPVMLWNFTPQPEGVTFSSSVLETISTKETYVNYEFIYSGKSGNTISFLYREYTADDLVKPAFAQTVNYDVSDKEIRFKNIKLELLEIGSSSISARVISL